MTTGIQISGTTSAGLLPFSQGQPSSANTMSGGQEFNALLGFLASLMMSGGMPVSAADQGGNSENTSLQTPTVPASASAGATSVDTGQQSTGIILPGNRSANQEHEPENKPTQSAASMLAAFPFISPYQILGATQDQPSSSSNSGQSTGAASSVIPPNIEQELCALLNGSQSPTTDSSANSETVDAAHQTGNNDKSGMTAPLQTGAASVNATVKADLLKILSAASSGQVDTQAVGELSGLIGRLDGGSSNALQTLVQRLKDGSTAVASRQSTSVLQAGNPQAPTSTASLQPSALSVDSNGVMVYGAEAGSRNLIAANSQFPVVVTVSGTPNADGAASSAPAANQNSVSGNANMGGGSQATSNPDPVAVGQSSPFATSQPDQNAGSSTDSGKNFSDLLKTGVSQVYQVAMDDSKGNASVSFGQTLTSAAQNRAPANSYPSLDHLTQSIVREVNLMNQGGKTVVNMKLEPDSLGSVTLQVSSENGKISAQFNVRTPDARTYLESSVPQMKQALESNGVSLSHLTVSLSSGQSQSKNSQYQYRPRKQQSKYYDVQLEAGAAVNLLELSRDFGYNTMEMKV